MKSFGIITISNKRPRILELFCYSIQRIRQEMDIFIPCVVVGDKGHKEICQKYHINHITQDNHPATRKWNTGTDFMMRYGVDYILVVGSDDILSTDLVKKLYSQMQQGTDLIGIKSCYFYSADGIHRGELKRLESTQILGVARCISRKVIEQAGVVWPEDKSWGMDAICSRSIGRYVKSIAFVEGVVVDVKNKESLNKYTMWNGRINKNSPPKVFYNILSEDEIRLLIQIQ